MFLNMQIFQIWVRFWKTSQKTLGRLSEDFLGSLIMYFMLDDFPRSLREVVCPRWYKGMMSSGVQAYLCGGIISSSICNSFVYCLFYDLYVYYFSCEFFCKLEEILIKRIWYIFSCFFPKYLTLLKLLIQHTKKSFKPFYPLITKHNNTKT